MASVLPKSTITLPNSNLLTIPLKILSFLSTNSLNCLSRSASLTFELITCFAICAAIRPKSKEGNGCNTSSPIDLSLLFTWRQIAKMKNSVSTNLLILDETFDSSLDYEGVENLLKILTTLPDETNVFVISHKGEILDNKFEDKIEFVKVKNFSKIAA